jgi:multiple sugar transport system substrate-binding protein
MSLWKSQHHSFALKIVVEPVNSMVQTETTRVQGGQPPAIAGLTTAWMPAFANAGALVNLRSLLPASYLKSYVPSLLAGNTYKSGLYVLPYAASTRALFYNKTEFAKAGITTPPATWAELQSDAARIVKSKAAKFALSVEGTGTEAFSAWFPYFYWSYGGSFAGPGGKLTVQQNACVKALSVLNGLIKIHAVEPNPQTYDADQELGAFTSSDAAMTITGPWLMSLLQGTGIQYGVAPIPAGTSQSTLGVTDGWVVFKKSGVAQTEVKDALTFLMSPPVENNMLQEQKFLATDNAGLGLSLYKSSGFPTFTSLLSSAHFAPLNAQWNTEMTEGVKDLQGMYVSSTSPASTCQALASQTQS